MKIRYLFDENMDSRFTTVLARHYPRIDVLFIVSKQAPYKQLADLLFLYWDASEAEEWIDRVK